MAASRFLPPTPSFPIRSLQGLPRTTPRPRLGLATRLHPTTMLIPHRHDLSRSTFAVLPVFDVFVLFRLRPCDDETPEVPEESGAAGNCDEPAEFPRDDALDASLVRGRGPWVFQAV
jgi:hypothetical protein